MDIDIEGLLAFDIAGAYWNRWWPADALDLLGEALEEDTRLRLEDDTASPAGAEWDPWSPAYADTRGPQHKLLYSTGALARSLEFQRRGDMIEFGSPLPYALAHQSGVPSRRLPARPYVGISRELSAALDDIYTTDFERGWRGRGLG